MKASYKIALALAAGITVLIVIFYTTRDDGGEQVQPADDTLVQSTDTQTPRPSLRSDAPASPATTTPPASSPTPSNQPDRRAQILQMYAAARQQQEQQHATETGDAGESVPPSTSRPAPTATNTPAATNTAPPSIASADRPAAPSADQWSAVTPPTPTASDRPAAPATTTPPPAPAASRPAATPQTYTVVAGDNLSRIAQKVFGDDHYWVDIAQANPTVDPTKLKIGQQLRLPARGDLRSAADDIKAPADARVYTVRAGDTLSTIAEMHYGSSADWRLVYNANRDQIGPNPDRIKAGTKLVIPPALPKSN